MGRAGLVVIETHPVQYHAPIYKNLQQKYNIPTTVIYGSDLSAHEYYDSEFGRKIAWGTDLLSGYQSVFLSQTRQGLRKILGKINPKAVLLLGYHPIFNKIAIYESLRSGLPIIFRGETTDRAVNRGIFKKTLRDAALRWLYRRCDKVLYIGKCSYAHFKRLGCPEEKMGFSPYCVDTSVFQQGESFREKLRSEVRASLGIGPTDIVILFSGKLSHRKGVDRILPAAKEAAEGIEEKITVLFLGHGDMKTYLENQAHKISEIKVNFAGFQNQTGLSPYYHASDLLVLPSRHSETWGLVVNEALHHGLPCVVSDRVGCALDLVEPGITGEIFQEDSPGALTEAFERSLALIKNVRTRDRCREKVSGYTVDRATEGVVQALMP